VLDQQREGQIMSDEKNVIDFGARAAAERARRQGFLLSELDGSTVKSILDSAYIDCRLDGDGDCVVDDELRLVATADPARDVFKVFAYFWATGTRQQVLEFCQRFNANLIVVKAQMRDSPDSDGQWPVAIDHERLVFEEERLEPRTIVKLVRRFQFIVRNGMTRYDTEKLF
jgi:hypothetical protein